MPKYHIQMLYTVTYEHREEIEAATKTEAEEKAECLFEYADCAKDWKVNEDNLEIYTIEKMEG